MKIVIAPDSFKESLTAQQVAQAIQQGFSDVIPEAEFIQLPVADGGEGTTSALITSTQGTFYQTQVQDPLGQTVLATWGVLGDGKTAVIETAAASGLDLIPIDQRNPMITSSYGTGELIRAALDQGATNIIFGLGGSATNDGGAGLLRALGAKLLDSAGHPLAPGGGSLHKLADLDISQLDQRLQHVTFKVACDVDNPLLGPDGASSIFGPQKGASQTQVSRLDQNLEHFAQFLTRASGVDVRDIPGTGAAGGIGAALCALFKTELQSGIEIVLNAVNFDQHLKTADLVITGEGSIDGQSLRGKTPVGVAKRAKAYNCPVIALAGSVSPKQAPLQACGIDAIFSIVPGIVSLQNALEEAELNLQNCARNLATLWALGLRRT
ncbi:glycerate kinase [Neptuniibacter sp. QD48_55]|uniref:glycerate kinase n=1 Tax=Neptuniibacter sp. QD48_55 TaxID=3398212 RepID=UPI0039F5FEAE